MTTTNDRPDDSSSPQRRSQLDEVLLKYYLHQWEQVRHCENIRSSFTLQLLTVAAGSVAGFFYAKGCAGIQLGLSLVVLIIGILGFLVVLALERASNIHIDRAREARKQFPEIEMIAAKTRGFVPIARYFLALNCIVIGFGFVLAAQVVITTPWQTGQSAMVCRK